MTAADQFKVFSEHLQKVLSADPGSRIFFVYHYVEIAPNFEVEGNLASSKTLHV